MKPRISQLDQSGAADGDRITWDDTAGEWVPAAASGTYTDEQARDAIGAALVAGSNVTITVNDAGDTITIDAASGGMTHSFLGTNSVGATTEAPTAGRNYFKKITVVTACLLASIDVHLKDNGGGSVAAFSAALYSDASGSPGKVLGIGSGVENPNSYVPNTTGGWVGVAIGQWLPAGDYWLDVMFNDAGSLLFAVTTTGGADKYWDPGGAWWADSGFYTVNSTTKDYSIRASVIT